MRRPDVRKLVIKTFRCQGPLTDAELAWWIGHVLKQNPATAKRVRIALTKDGEIRFAHRVKVTANGRLQKKWELASKPN